MSDRCGAKLTCGAELSGELNPRRILRGLFNHERSERDETADQLLNEHFDVASQFRVFLVFRGPSPLIEQRNAQHAQHARIGIEVGRKLLRLSLTAVSRSLGDEVGLVAAVEEDHAVKVFALDHRPPSAVSRLHLVAAIPRPLDGSFSISRSRPTIHLTVDAAEVELTTVAPVEFEMAVSLFVDEVAVPSAHRDDPPAALKELRLI